MTTERTYTVLVIEDDPAVAEGLVEGIGNEGYDVHWESTGARWRGMGAG